MFSTSAKVRHVGKENTVVFSQPGKPLVSLGDIVDKVPITKDDYVIQFKRTLFNFYLQTMYSQNLKGPHIQVHYKRYIKTFEDGGLCAVDYALPKLDTPEKLNQFAIHQNETQKKDWPGQSQFNRFCLPSEIAEIETPDPSDDSWMLVFLPGYAAGPEHPFLREAVVAAQKSGKFKHICVIGPRGLNKTPITDYKLYGLYCSVDLYDFIEEISQKFPKRRIALVGHSFGCVAGHCYNIRKPRHHRVEIVVNIASPLDFKGTLDIIMNSFVGKILVLPAVWTHLRKNILYNQDKLLNMESVKQYANFDDELLSKPESFKTITLDYVVKSLNFTSGDEYLSKVSPHNSILDIRTPTFFINSDDDIMIPKTRCVEDITVNPYTVMFETDYGAHLGHFRPDGSSWSNDVAVQIISNFFETVEPGYMVDDQGFKRKKNWMKL